jgi:Polysulfide reductase
VNEADGGRTYYGQPVLKAPTWKAFIPAYIYLGGLAAGSSLLAAGASATRDRRLQRVASVAALGAISGGAVALVADLGRPSRFHHMLRVFRPSSPMNVGSWVLAAYGPAAGLAAVSELTGIARPVGRVATWTAAAIAPAVATYTGVLVSDTAVPAWHDARHSIPPLFAAGAAASAGGVAASMLPDSSAARRYAIGGALGEVVISAVQHRRLEPEVARAYNEGRACTLRRIGAGASIAGAALLAFGARRRSLARIGSLSIAMGALAERFAVMEAGRASAADPIATIAPQRRRA